MVGRGGTLSTENSNANSMKSAIEAQNPVLTIISLTCNDYGGQTALATYKTQLQTIITKARLYGDVLLTTLGIHYQNYTIPQQQYWNVVFELARENNVALVDIAAKWGYTAQSAYNLGFLPSTTQVHPDDQGQEDISSFLFDVLTKMM